MRKRTTVLLMAALLGASGGAVSVHASGAGNPSSAGLVPPASAYSGDTRAASTSPGLWRRERQLGLKPRMDPRQRVEAPIRHAAGLTFYSATRIGDRPGLGLAQSYSGVRYPLSVDWSSALEASVQPAQTAASRAYTLAGRLDRLLPGGRGLSLGLRYSVQEHEAPGMLRLAGSQAPFVGQGLSHPLAASYASGYELKLSYRYGERNSVGLSYGSAPEFDIARAWPGSHAAEGRQYSLTGRHWLTSDWSLSYGLTAAEQGARGQGLRLGLRYSF
jgi:hypothetical protein